MKMKIPFYLLGLLIRYGPQHGYSLKQYISEGIADFSKIKLPSIYYNLNKLLENGYVTASVDREGNRPEKTIYAITDQGRKYFSTLLGEIVAEEFQTEFNLDGVLYFYELGDMEYILNALQRRQKELTEKSGSLTRHREKVLKDVPDHAEFFTKAIFNHHLYHLEAELKWLAEVIGGLSTD